jgi:general secretion pathway protein L
MAESLLIRLGSNALDTIRWMVWSASDQSIIASGELANAEQLTQLTDKAQTRRVTVLVPTCEVAVNCLNVPAKTQKAIRLAAPYMLEDELGQDVEELFFAYGEDKKYIADKNCFIAVVKRQQMTLWLTWLSDAGLSTKQMLPDVLALPEVSEQWQAITIGKQILVRQSQWQGMLIDEQHWVLAKQSWHEIQEVNIDAYSTLPECSENIMVNYQPEELPLALFSQNIAGTSFNLLQGEYQVLTQRSPLLKTWSWAIGIGIFALLLNLGIKSVTLMNINQKQQVVEQQVIEEYKAAFPKTKKVRISTIRSQLKRKMAEIGSSNNEASFLAMLEKVQPAFSQVPELKPESLKFDSKRNELRLQAIAKDYQHFEKFKTLLEQKQLSVTQGAQNNQGDSVSGSFSITAKKGDKS